MTKTVIKNKNNKQNQQNYADFIKQLDIEDIRLASATIKNLDCEYYPSAAEVRWTMSAKYENADNKIVVFNRYNVRILEKGKEPKAKLSIIFCVTYKSEIPMSDELFNRFKNRNLPLNTWPYFREYLHSTVLRMGWPPFIAPALVT